MLNDLDTTAIDAERARRNTLAATYYVPDVDSTGLLTTSPLPRWLGDLTAQPGQVIENLEIWGRVIVKAPGVTVRNCWVRGNPDPAGAPTVDTALIETSGDATDLLVEDSLLEPMFPHWRLDGIRRWSYTARRVRVRGVTDGFGAFPAKPGGVTDVRILSCWVEQLARFVTDDVHTDGTHNDCVQVQGGSGILITGNRFDARTLSATGGDSYGVNRSGGNAAMSCVMLTPNVGRISGCVIQSNLCLGGEISISGGALRQGDSVQVKNNRFDHRQTLGGQYGSDTSWTLNINPAASLTAVDNLYLDNQKPVRLRRGA